MIIRTLEDTSETIIFNAFKEAFKDYILPLDMRIETHLMRWKNSGVDFAKSYGAFIDNELVAFVLHLSLEGALYNFGTGVIPKERGKRIVSAIYEKINEDHGQMRMRLEVIQENLKAFHLYERLGFQIIRRMDTYEGKFELPQKKLSLTYVIKPLQYNEEMKALRLFRPATEASQEVLMRNSSMHELHELRVKEKLLAFAIYTPMNATLQELGAEDIAHLDELFLSMKLSSQRVRIINVDSCALELSQYLETHGQKKIVSQYEMERSLS